MPSFSARINSKATIQTLSKVLQQFSINTEATGGILVFVSLPFNIRFAVFSIDALNKYMD